jgi:hypothetical protein
MALLIWVRHGTTNPMINLTIRTNMNIYHRFFVTRNPSCGCLSYILGDCLYFPTMCHDYCIWFLFWNLGNMLFVREHGVKYVAPIEITKCSWLMCNKHPLLEKRNVWEWKPVTWAIQQYTKHRIRLSKKDRFFKKFNSNDLFKSKKFSRPNPTRIL